MKQSIFNKVALGITLMLGLSSCDDRELVTIDNESAPVVMDLSKSNLILDANFPNNPALKVQDSPNWPPLCPICEERLSLSSQMAAEGATVRGYRCAPCGRDFTWKTLQAETNG